MMKNKKPMALFLILVMSVVMAAPVFGAGPSQVTITVNGQSALPLAGAQRVGANIEMSMISDAMWQANGNWMAQSFYAGELNMMRWGYDAWAFDWETETPLSQNRYWGGLNSKDAAGSFGLEEFIAFCKANQIIPFVMIPIESLDAFGGEATLEKVAALTTSMAQYIAAQGIELCYFDMGNEPWNNGAGSISSASYLGGLFPSFQQIVKAANPNFRLVLQRAPQNILWNAWNNTLVSAANGAFDAYDDHRYSFFGWNNYFDYNSDSLLTPGGAIEGKEAILGECNIGWTPVQDNWNEGHVRDMGGSMALLNAMLNIIDSGTYAYIISWPSHYPSKASISGCPNNAFGWFDLDRWYLDGQTVRLSGPALAHRIINQNVLPNKLDAQSTGEKVRVFAYENDAKTDLRVIVLNKWDATTLTLNVPAQYDAVSAMAMTGNSVWDVAPQYTNHMNGIAAVNGGVLENSIPAESVVVYTFTASAQAQTPATPILSAPENGFTNVGTAQTFSWQADAAAQNYHLTVSQNADLSSPVIDTDTGKATRYQASAELQQGTTYYWQVQAASTAGTAQSAVTSFTTQTVPGANKLILNNDSVFISHSANWNQQSSDGSYHNDDMSCAQKDGFAEFTFIGTGAEIYGITGNWCGVADVQIDFGAPTRIDTYTPATQAQALLFSTGELPYGEHTVTLTVVGEKNAASSGTWIEYDKVIIADSQNGQPTADKVVWNDENPNLTKFSRWTHQSVAGCYHNDDSASNTWKAYIEFSFNGTNAAVYGLKGPWCGKADISVDGVQMGRIDTYAAAAQPQQLLYDTGTLAEGTHTVRITVAANKSTSSSGKWVEIDKVVWQ